MEKVEVSDGLRKRREGEIRYNRGI